MRRMTSTWRHWWRTITTQNSVLVMMISRTWMQWHKTIRKQNSYRRVLILSQVGARLHVRVVMGREEILGETDPVKGVDGVAETDGEDPLLRRLPRHRHLHGEELPLLLIQIGVMQTGTRIAGVKIAKPADHKGFLPVPSQSAGGVWRGVRSKGMRGIIVEALSGVWRAKPADQVLLLPARTLRFAGEVCVSKRARAD